MTETLLVAACASFLLAGTVKGLTGLGLPIAAVGILSHFTDPRTAISLIIIPIFVSNIWQMRRQGLFLQSLRNYWPLTLALIGVLGVTVVATSRVDSDWLLIVIGIAIAGFSLISLGYTPPALAPRLDRPIQVITGVAAGILGGLTGIWGPPLVMYLMARRVDKEEFVRASGLLLFAGGIPLAAGYVHAGQLDGERALLSLGLVIPTLLGFAVGEVLRKRLDSEQFRKLILLFFLIVGLNLVRRAIW